MSTLSFKVSQLRHNLKKAAFEQPVVQDLEAIANRALQPLIGLIQGYLVRNYEASVRPNTDNKPDKRGPAGVLDAIANSKVWAAVRNGRLYVRFGLKPGLSERAYIATASLDFGSVSAPHRSFQKVDIVNAGYAGYGSQSVLGKRAKQSVKKAAYSVQDVSKRSSAYLQKASNVAVRRPHHDYVRSKGKVDIAAVQNRKTTEAGSVRMGGGVVVRKPRYFYRLTGDQHEDVKTKLFAAIELLLHPGAKI